VEVPGGNGMGMGGLMPGVDSLGGDSYSPRCGEALSDQDQGAEAEAANEYVQKHMALENRLQNLEEALDQATHQSVESEVFNGLKAVMKDVRQCLQRCELLYQLPEIRVMVKRFERSLQVNAILHERWLGPGAGRAQPGNSAVDALLERPSSHTSDGGEGMQRNSEHARSAPDLKVAKAREGRSGLGAKRSSRNGEKKPFRTVVDWCRPHTPLKVDPVLKHGSRAASGDSDRTHLPQIVKA